MKMKNRAGAIKHPETDNGRTLLVKIYETRRSQTAHNRPVKKQLLIASQEEARRGVEDSRANVPSPQHTLVTPATPPAPTSATPISRLDLSPARHMLPAGRGGGGVERSQDP